MNRAWCFLIAVAWLSSAACSSRAPSTPAGALGPSPSVNGFSTGLFLADSAAALAQRKYITSANFGTLRDLWIRAAVPSMPTTTPVKVSFITPRGELFRYYYAYFSPDPAVTRMDVPGADHPMDVTTALAVPGGHHLDFSVAISGSPFTKFPEPGVWTLRAEVAGHAEPLVATLAVEVRR